MPNDAEIAAIRDKVLHRALVRDTRFAALYEAHQELEDKPNPRPETTAALNALAVTIREYLDEAVRDYLDAQAERSNPASYYGVAHQ